MDATHETSEVELLNHITIAIPSLQTEIEQLDHAKKPFTKKLSKHKSNVRKIMKRKLEEAQDHDPSTTEISLDVNDITFKMEEVVSCPPCKVDDMLAYFSKENVEQYMQATEKKRLKLTIE